MHWFGVDASAQECTALFGTYDTGCDGSINYSEFLEHRRTLERAEELDRQTRNNPDDPGAVSVAPGTTSSKDSSKPRRRSFKETKELEALDRDLPALEARKEAIEQAIGAGNEDLASLSMELATLLETLSAAEERWLELSELAP